MQDLRLVLIILGLIAIVALIVHGLWTNKKNQVKPLRNKVMDNIDPSAKDSQGFDMDGIGSKRVVRKQSDDEPTEPSVTSKPVPVNTAKIEPQFKGVSAHDDDVISFTATDSELLESEDNAVSQMQFDNNALNQRDTHQYDTQIINSEINTESVSQDEQERAPLEPVISHVEKLEAANEILDRDASTIASEDVSESAQDAVADVEEMVFVINVMARENKQINGALLLQELLPLGFKFGEMDIFHRHVDCAGKGAVIFSLANMVKPGTFDIDNIEQFQTPGVSLFMMFPCANEASTNYNMMLHAAEHIASGVDGLLMNASRQPLTADLIQQDKETILALEANAKKRNQQ